jgi:hypothetical protein
MYQNMDIIRLVITITYCIHHIVSLCVRWLYYVVEYSESYLTSNAEIVSAHIDVSELQPPADLLCIPQMMYECK